MSIATHRPQKLVLVPDNTGEKQVSGSNSRRFQPGQSGNPRGRPRGSRNKLAETFLHDLLSEWMEHGTEVVQLLRKEDPAAFARIIAMIVRNVPEPPPSDVNALTDAEIDTRLWHLLAQMLGSMPPAQFPAKLLCAGLSAETIAALGEAALGVQDVNALEEGPTPGAYRHDS